MRTKGKESAPTTCGVCNKKLRGDYEERKVMNQYHCSSCWKEINDIGQEYLSSSEED